MSPDEAYGAMIAFLEATWEARCDRALPRLRFTNP